MTNQPVLQALSIPEAQEPIVLDVVTESKHGVSHDHFRFIELYGLSKDHAAAPENHPPRTCSDVRIGCACHLVAQGRGRAWLDSSPPWARSL
jgi:hypothetical protein